MAGKSVTCPAGCGSRKQASVQAITASVPLKIRLPPATYTPHMAPFVQDASAAHTA